MMDDLTICKRIAEIDGKSYWKSGTGDGVYVNYIEGNKDSRILYYNPLTTDALCFQLMIKYKIKLTYEYDFTWLCFSSYTSNKLLSKNSNPNKAICLAIIEADK
jgi:hypothetical protein